MSLLDEILSQQAVVISAGVAVLFIFAAIFVAMFSRVKKSRARQQRRRAAAAARAALIQQEAQAQVEAAAPVNAAVTVTKAATPTPTAAVTPAAPAIKPPAAPILAAAPAAQEKPKEETASPAMNDLLSSVFSDEENSARQALLLKGMEPVDVEDLVMLCKSVIGQLRGEKPSHVVTIKEQQLS